MEERVDWHAWPTGSRLVDITSKTQDAVYMANAYLLPMQQNDRWRPTIAGTEANKQSFDGVSAPFKPYCYAELTRLNRAHATKLWPSASSAALATAPHASNGRLSIPMSPLVATARLVVL